MNKISVSLLDDRTVRLVYGYQSINIELNSIHAPRHHSPIGVFVHILEIAELNPFYKKTKKEIKQVLGNDFKKITKMNLKELENLVF